MTGPFFYSPHIQATAMRKQLWKAGFRPVPVLSWTEDADGAGKRPKGFAWPETARLDPPEAACNPAEFDALNTGLLCDGLQAIDIDIDNLELVDQLRSAAIEILGSAPVRRRYNSPRCLLLYRAADGSPKKKTYASVFGKIEILGHGQQFVAFGQHPSGALYTWAPEAPGEFLITEVPTVTLDQIHSFLDKSATILGADDKFGGDQSSPLSSPLGLQASIEVVESALSALPNDDPADWDWWNKIGMATWAATNGDDRGYQAWRGWSAKHGTFDENECEKRWKHYALSPPASVGAGTLIYLAQKAYPEWAAPVAVASPSEGKLPEPNLAILHGTTSKPPNLPVPVFGSFWADWLDRAAQAANVPPDYVAMPLLATAATLLGNARSAGGWPGWTEPSVLWCASVGNPSAGKTSGASIMTNLLDRIEKRQAANHDPLLQEWRTALDVAKIIEKQWKVDATAAHQKGDPLPPKPAKAVAPSKPVRPRVSVADATIEKIAAILSGQPKGLLVRRDELSGWLQNLSRYSSGTDRPFWLEAYTGNSHQVDRVKLEEPIFIPRLSLSINGTIQPGRLTDILTDVDDGLVSRFLWAWPNPTPFAQPTVIFGQDEALEPLWRLAGLVMNEGPDGDLQPRCVPLCTKGRPILADFAEKIASKAADAAGLMASSLGKVRGQTLRLALILEYLWWCPTDGAEPSEISEAALLYAIRLMETYFLPMCGRVLGDAAATTEERNARLLANWLVQKKPKSVNVTGIRDTAQLPGLRSSDSVKAACRYLEEAGWLIHRTTGQPGRPRGDFQVNPRLWPQLSSNTE